MAEASFRETAFEIARAGASEAAFVAAAFMAFAPAAGVFDAALQPGKEIFAIGERRGQRIPRPR